MAGRLVAQESRDRWSLSQVNHAKEVVHLRSFRKPGDKLLRPRGDFGQERRIDRLSIAPEVRDEFDARVGGETRLAGR